MPTPSNDMAAEPEKRNATGPTKLGAAGLAAKDLAGDLAAGTRIDLAIADAHLQLTSSARRPTARRSSRPLMASRRTPLPTPYATRRERAKDDELPLFTLGLSSDIDEQLLEVMASKPAWYFPAPDTSDLEAMCEQYAYKIPCEPVWP